MRFGKWIGLSVLWLAIVACAAHFVAPPDALVLYAQTLPMTVHAIWNVNPAPPPFVGFGAGRPLVPPTACIPDLKLTPVPPGAVFVGGAAPPVPSGGTFVKAAPQAVPGA